MALSSAKRRVCQLFGLLRTGSWELRTVFRGVSSTVKLSVSKTELGGSNPSAPARVRVKPRAKSRPEQQSRKAGSYGNSCRTKRDHQHVAILAGTHQVFLQRRSHGDEEGHLSFA